MMGCVFPISGSLDLSDASTTKVNITGIPSSMTGASIFDCLQQFPVDNFCVLDKPMCQRYMEKSYPAAVGILKTM